MGHNPVSLRKWITRMLIGAALIGMMLVGGRGFLGPEDLWKVGAIVLFFTLIWQGLRQDQSDAALEFGQLDLDSSFESGDGD